MQSEEAEDKDKVGASAPGSPAAKGESMKKYVVMLTFLGIATGTALLAHTVWGLPHKSNVAVFRIITVGFIPLPLPIGIFTSPHLGGGLLYGVAFILAAAGFGQLKK